MGCKMLNTFYIMMFCCYDISSTSISLVLNPYFITVILVDEIFYGYSGRVLF